MTTDLGHTWKYLTNYIFDFEWGQSKHAVAHDVFIPEKRVFYTRDQHATGHQADAKK